MAAASRLFATDARLLLPDNILFWGDILKPDNHLFGAETT
jgi:hypothetical protein